METMFAEIAATIAIEVVLIAILLPIPVRHAPAIALELSCLAIHELTDRNGIGGWDASGPRGASRGGTCGANGRGGSLRRRVGRDGCGAGDPAGGSHDYRCVQDRQAGTAPRRARDMQGRDAGRS